MHLAMNNLDTVLSTLSALLDDSANLEDAILLRLAQAEKNKVDNQSNKWRLKLKERIVFKRITPRSISCQRSCLVLFNN